MANPSTWPTNKLSALRLGNRLVTEVPASTTGRRAFVDITPSQDERDVQAHNERWVHSDAERSFRLTHREYEADRLDGFDRDHGAELVRSAVAADEAELVLVLAAWQLTPNCFVHPWESDDPA